MVRLALSVVVIASIGCGRPSSPQPPPETQTIAEPAPTQVATTCREHVELYDGAFWAKELGRPEMWVIQNHRIRLFDGLQTRLPVGEMRVGSRAVILERTDDGYRVESPLDQSVGWISAIQVTRTLHQDITTREPCTP